MGRVNRTAPLSGTRPKPTNNQKAKTYENPRSRDSRLGTAGRGTCSDVVPDLWRRFDAQLHDLLGRMERTPDG